MVVEFRRRSCQDLLRLSKSTFLVMISDNQREFYLSIPDEDWIIRSFDYQTRLVCTEITTPQGIVNTAAVTLPRLTITQVGEP